MDDAGFIDVGRKSEDMYGDMPASVDEEEKNRVHYPTVYFPNVNGLELGDSGVAEIKFDVCERREEIRDSGKNISYEIKIKAIRPKEASKQTNEPERSSEDDIEDGLKDAQKD